MLFEQPKATGHGIHLICQPLVTLWHVGDGVGIVFDTLAEIFQQQLVVEFVRRDRRRQVCAVADFLEEFGQDFDGIFPQTVKFIGGELDVIEIVQQHVELIIAYLILDADAGGCQVGRTGDDGTRFVFVESFGPKNVELGVKAFGGMRSQFNLLGNDVIDELEDASFHVAFVFSALNILAKPIAKFLQRLGGVGEKQKAAPVIVRHDRVHVDADEDADVRTFSRYGRSAK